MDTPPSPTPYKPLIFQPTSQEDRKSVSREVAKDWLNFLSGKTLSISQWRKMGPISLDGQNKHGVNHSISITFNRAVEHILDNQGFSLDSFDIRNERFIPWADPSGSLSLQLYWERPGTNGTCLVYPSPESKDSVRRRKEGGLGGVELLWISASFRREGLWCIAVPKARQPDPA